MNYDHLAALVVVFLAGCTLPDADFSNDVQCIEYVCLADPDSHDARYMLETYGLRQITDDDNTPGRVQVEGDFVLWQTHHTFNDNPASDLFVYRFSTNELTPIALSEHHLYSRAELRQGRVVYSVEPQAGAHDIGDPMVSWLEVWNVTTEETRRLDTGLDGVKQFSQDFDGDWVVVANQGTPNGSQDAIWAHNIHDGRNVHIYTPLPDREHPNGTFESFTAITVADGKVYLGMTRQEPGGPGVSWMTRINLDAGERDKIYRGNVSFPELGVQGDMILGGSGDGVGLRNVGYGGAWPMLPPGEGQNKANAGSFNSEWVLIRNFVLQSDIPATFWAYHIPTQEARRILDSRTVVVHEPFDEPAELAELAVIDAVLDDERAVVQIGRNVGENFEAGTGDDLYWMPVSTMEKKWQESTVSAT